MSGALGVVGFAHISLGHLPPHLHQDGNAADTLHDAPGIQAVNDDAWLIYTPALWRNEHPEIEQIREYGRQAGCDWLLLEDCGAIAPGLPTYGMVAEVLGHAS